MRKHFKIIFVTVLVLGAMVSMDASAQCAMCKATQNSSGWSSRGLNAGILYLMAIPYIAMSVLGYFWYKASRKPKTQNQS
jgi:hypothetical protein